MRIFAGSIAVFLLLLTIGAPVHAGGVSSISEDGKSGGSTAYQVICTNGKKFRIWNDGSQWRDAVGAQGGKGRSITQQAEFLCR
ncbi:hypothetical protein C8N32_10333 [Rhodovulum imhoffii]|uniref:Uncharacterized protein n=1 Tax=Rhodovulum imhoffii TaxID=365340 RepID=A0A2T5BUJ1_9RHOB|nr:hypothetical protein [Rhodovulum imhoffii]PTN03191.1 hypothetical protein C8N32_10333 [Rhodovulum imhoffii]